LADFAQLAYGELRRVAAHWCSRESQNHTLQPTALVHEVYIRLAGTGPRKYANRAHFVALASRVMRQILVDAARRRNANKRGGAWQRVPLDELQVSTPGVPDYPAIDSALRRLTTFDPRSAHIAELRIFAGLSVREIAEVLHLAPTTVRARWAIARAWLGKQLQRN